MVLSFNPSAISTVKPQGNLTVRLSLAERAIIHLRRLKRFTPPKIFTKNGVQTRGFSNMQTRVKRCGEDAMLGICAGALGRCILFWLAEGDLVRQKDAVVGFVQVPWVCSTWCACLVVLHLCIIFRHADKSQCMQRTFNGWDVYTHWVYALIFLSCSDCPVWGEDAMVGVVHVHWVYNTWYACLALLHLPGCIVHKARTGKSTCGDRMQ